MFDESYYRILWGGVHRHDYCHSLATRLIQLYGKVRFLDIGTGCGHLVKCLRERGANAWGVDISDHALQNSCAPHYVRHADVRSLPFTDSAFDVVHSQGLWEYIPDADVQRAWRECKRVGQYQVHDFETADMPWDPDYRAVTWRPRKWWMNQFSEAVLVACPVCLEKDYSLDRWIEAARALDYEHKELLVVDDSRSGDLVSKWSDKVEIIHIDTGSEPQPRRIALCMEKIREIFIERGYAWWLNLESDIIAPPETLRTLLHGCKTLDLDWFAHIYPDRVANTLNQSGFGCELWSRRIILGNPFSDMPVGSTCDAWWWHSKILPTLRSNAYRVVEGWNLVNLEHLNG